MTRIVMLVSLSVLLCSGQDVRLRPSSKSDRALRTRTPQGDRAVAARAFDVDVTYLGGKSVLGSLDLLHDPQGRHFLWTYSELSTERIRNGRRWHVERPEQFRPGWTLYVTDQRILLCRGIWDGVTIWESTGDTAASLDEAEAKALSEVRAELGKRHRFGITPRRTAVDLVLLLGREFLMKPWDSFPKQPEILSFAQLPNGNFELTVRAYWAEKVMLDPRFKPLSHEKLQ